MKTIQSLNENTACDKQEKTNSRRLFLKIVAASVGGLLVAGPIPVMAKAINNHIDDIENSADLQKIERIKKYITIDGKKLDSLSIKKIPGKSNIFDISFEYEFKNKEGELIGNYPVKIDISVQDVQNNSFVKFEELTVSGVKMETELRIKKINVFDIGVTQGIDNQKNFDIRLVYNEKRSLEELDKKILSYDLKNSTTIISDPELENTQLTGLNNISLSKDIVHSPDKQIYRPIFLQEAGQYREIGKIIFDDKGEVDVDKTQAEIKDFTVLNTEISLNLDLSKNTFGIKEADIDTLTNKVKGHRKAIKQYVENTRIGDPKIFEGLNNIGGVWSKTNLISLSIINDTYGLQWGKDSADMFKFLFSQENKIKFRDYKGDPTDKYTVNINSDDKSTFKEVTIVEGTNDGGKMVITNEDSESMSYNLLPNLTGEMSNSMKVVKLTDANAQKGVGYFKEKGEKISFIPSSKTQNNQWKLGNLSENVNTNDLFDENMLKGHNLNSYNLTISDLYKGYEELMKNTGITLNARKVIKIVNDNGKSVYRQVKQDAEGSDFIISIDKELEEKAVEANSILSENLNILKTIANTKLLYKDGDQEYDFHGYLGGKEGIGFHSLKSSETVDFIKKNPADGVRNISRLLTRGEGIGDDNNSQEIGFIVKGNKIEIDGKKGLFCKAKKVAGIEQKTYKITYNAENNQSKLYFQTVGK